MQLTNVILETDSIHALNMIQNRYTSIFHLQPLLQEIIHLINRSGSTIRINHIHREANTCADALALRGHQADFSVPILDVIQPSIKLLIDKDLFNLIKVCIHDISQTSFNLIIKNIRHFCIKRKN
jgi:hypothetical protein